MAKKRTLKRRKSKTRKTINLDICPKCGKQMFKHISMCPYCGNPILENIGKCPYCKKYIHGTNHLTRKRKRKGGAGCGPFGCPISPLSWNAMQSIKTSQTGGVCGASMCGTTNITTSQNGGVTMPGPFVGSAWTGKVADWPGVNGVGSDKNYNTYNTYTPVDISRQMRLNDTQVGGKYKRRRYKGGSTLMKDDLVNLGRDFMYKANSVYNTLNGYPAPIDPAPYKGHFAHSSKIIV